jgi:hypothetical protein
VTATLIAPEASSLKSQEIPEAGQVLHKNVPSFQEASLRLPILPPLKKALQPAAAL